MKVKVAILIAPLAVWLLVGAHTAEAQQPTGKVWRVGALMSLYPPDAHERAVIVDWLKPEVT